VLARRIKQIEGRKRRPEKGDDILLSVITDGRHAAIDLCFVLDDYENEEGNKLSILPGVTALSRPARLLARRLDRGLRPRHRRRPHGPDLPRTRRVAAGPADGAEPPLQRPSDDTDDAARKFGGLAGTLTRAASVWRHS
jgi:hypothetical protein